MSYSQAHILYVMCVFHGRVQVNQHSLHSVISVFPHTYSEVTSDWQTSSTLWVLGVLAC